MADWPTIPPGFGYPLVDMDSKRLPDPTMEAIAGSPELSATIGEVVEAITPRDLHAIPFPEDALVAFWDFSEDAAPFRSKRGFGGDLPLESVGGSPVVSAPGGPFGRAAQFNGTDTLLMLAAANVGRLNVAAYSDQVTIIAWVKTTNSSQAQIAGMWDEGNERRQYALFRGSSVFVPISHVSSVRAQVSALGGPDPGYTFNHHTSLTARVYSNDKYRMIAATYDGEYLRTYLDGLTDSFPSYTEPEPPTGTGATYAKNPYHFTEGLYRGRIATDDMTPSDFTVGGVNITSGISNRFTGQIGGVAVLSRALSADEMMRIQLATSMYPEFLDLSMWTGNHGDGYYPTQLYGGKSYRGATATDTSSEQPTASAGRDFTYRYTSGARFLERLASPDVVDEDSIWVFDLIGEPIRLSQVRRISFEMNNSSTSQNGVRLAMKVGGAWFVRSNNQASAAVAVSESDWSNASTHTYTGESGLRSGASWRHLTFTPGSALTLGGGVSGRIPNGPLQAIGFFRGAGQAAGKVVRIRNLRVH